MERYGLHERLSRASRRRVPLEVTANDSYDELDHVTILLEEENNVVSETKKNYGKVRTTSHDTFQLPSELILELSFREEDRLMLIDANSSQIWLGKYLLVICGEINCYDIIDVVAICRDGLIELSESAYRRIGLFGGKLITVCKTKEGFILLNLWMNNLGDGIKKEYHTTLI